MTSGRELKPLFWVGSALKDQGIPNSRAPTHGICALPCQAGRKHIDAKALKGFGGAGVLEIVEDHDGDTYRAAYTVKFAGAVYTLHAFQKKSKKAIQTPRHHNALIKERLKRAEEHYREWFRDKSGDTR